MCRIASSGLSEAVGVEERFLGFERSLLVEFQVFGRWHPDVVTLQQDLKQRCRQVSAFRAFSPQTLFYSMKASIIGGQDSMS